MKTLTTTFDQILENVKALIGTQYSEEDIIIAFADYEEDGQSEVIVTKSYNGIWDYCAYINTENSQCVLIEVDGNEITDVFQF